MILTLILSMVAPLNSTGQNQEPTMVILFPNEIIVDPEIEKELKEKYGFSQETIEEEINERRGSISDDSLAILKEQMQNYAINDFYNNLALDSYLPYRLSNWFPNQRVFPIQEKSSSDLEKLAPLAEQYKVRYVLNFPKVHSVMQDNRKETTVRIQLYDHQQKKNLLDKDFTGNDKNPGFELSCEDGSLECTINNVQAIGFEEVINLIVKNSPDFIQDENLLMQKAEVLFSTYYPQKPANEIVEIIEKNKPTISTEGFYHGLMSEDKSKFVGFFALNSNSPNFKDLKSENDKGTTVITNDMQGFGTTPENCFYVVLGTKKNGKWHLKQNETIYFDTPYFEEAKKEYFVVLITLGFFKENSPDYNPEFWDSPLFNDLTKID